MHYTKAMIDITKEVRRRVDSDSKPDIKLANPDLFNVLQTQLLSTHDAVLKALLKELFFLAGDPWDKVLQAQPAEQRSQLRTYRGVSELRPAAEAESRPQRKTSQRIYRGQVVTD